MAENQESALKSSLDIVKDHISSYPNFPKEGIIFRDLFPILRSPKATFHLTALLVDEVLRCVPNVDVIVALESRGFLLAPLIASEIQLPIVPVRKKGKLPGKTIAVDYTLEYGKDTLEMQVDSIKPGQNVVIVDDLIGTGGTAGAVCRLVEQLKGNVSLLLVLMELTDLNGRANVPCKTVSLVQF